MSKKAKFFLVLSIVWFVLFATFAIFMFLNPSTVCWDGYDFEAQKMIGGCYDDYELTISIMFFPTLFWAFIQAILVGLFVWLKKKSTKKQA